MTRSPKNAFFRQKIPESAQKLAENIWPKQSLFKALGEL